MMLTRTCHFLALACGLGLAQEQTRSASEKLLDGFKGPWRLTPVVGLGLTKPAVGDSICNGQLQVQDGKTYDANCSENFSIYQALAVRAEWIGVPRWGFGMQLGLNRSEIDFASETKESAISLTSSSFDASKHEVTLKTVQLEVGPRVEMRFEPSLYAAASLNWVVPLSATMRVHRSSSGTSAMTSYSSDTSYNVDLEKVSEGDDAGSAEAGVANWWALGLEAGWVSKGGWQIGLEARIALSGVLVVPGNQGGTKDVFPSTSDEHQSVYVHRVGLTIARNFSL